MAVDGGDERLAIAPDLAKKFGDSAGIFLIFCRGLAGNGLEHVQIHASTKGFPVAGKNDDADAGLLKFVESGKKFGDHLGGDGVAFVGTVESDGGEIGGLIEKKCLVGHCKASPSVGAGAWEYLARISSLS